MHWLMYIKDGTIARQYSLTKPLYSLGRGTECDFVFDTQRVSRLHAVLQRDGDDYCIVDKGSTNHVFVNDEQVDTRTLTSGDTIALSSEVMLLYVSEKDFHENFNDVLNHMWESMNKENFLRLKEVTNRLISLDNLEHILQIVLQEVVKLVKAERGFIALTDRAGKLQKDRAIIHNIPLQRDGDWTALFSHSTVRQAIHSKEHVFILRSARDAAYDFSHSIIALNLQSIMCAPLLFGEKLVGILYVDSGYQRVDFSERDRLFFTILSDHAAIAIENAKLYSRVQQSIEQLGLNENRLEALLQLNHMTQSPIADIQTFTLKKALELSKSPIGYIGFFNRDETVLSSNCWAQPVMKESISEASKPFPVNSSRMLKKVVKLRKAIINNGNIHVDALKEGYPDAVTISRHMNIPMFEGRRVVAVLGVSNKEFPYEASDVRQLTLLMQAMWRIIQRKHAVEALKESEEKHRIFLESVPDPVIVYNLKGHITYLNPAFTRVFGWTRTTLMQHTAEFIPADKVAEAQLNIDKIILGETISGFETSRITEKGEAIEVSISGTGFFDGRGKLQGYVLTLQDISDRKKNEEEIRFLAYHDVLTKLPNRKAFYEHLDNKLLQEYYKEKNDRRTSAKNEKWALLFLDLDRFKIVNDTLGHDVGDELLKSVTSRLRSCLRQKDRIFRLGGDEFTIILHDLTETLEAATVSRKIQKELSRPHRIHCHELYVTVSIGISVYPTDGTKVEILVKNADMAMYAAKEVGGGYHFFTEDMNQRAQERLHLENGLQQAIRDEQFLLYYQPLVDSRNGIVGMEALIRWNHPQKGIISPDHFIPLAEETRTIVLIGKWVLNTACRQLKSWHDAGYDTLYMSVNVSTRQFMEADFVASVNEAVESSGLRPEFLKLEITESSIMEKPDEAIKKMNSLRAKGVHFSIDDFGTGYSSLSQMKRFPIDTLKIDRSFVMDSMNNHDDQEIIKAILSMAHNLHIETVAEGVETEEQKEFLTREGCLMMQGYYFGKPVTVDEFEKALQEHHMKES
ncbi:hypothetical protein CSA56_14575 [candidate division KSB3 bacterium]|uniref:Diguanylate cyclase n=1 Tax=candidate division KSB3 bacterium TaxID=2044937 RepID=A0A2G6KBH6_9BACT|nr:MAG: hypothetical protein CSA56_14575 [candidate division KSB3 bacterium]